jgi:hypothetical protein
LLAVGGGALVLFTYGPETKAAPDEPLPAFVFNRTSGDEALHKRVCPASSLAARAGGSYAAGRTDTQGVQLVSEADESTTGPASFTVVAPDDNPILVDQHV